MTDQQLWSAAVARIKTDYQALPQDLRNKLAELGAEIMALKARHQAAVSLAEPDRFCAECMGLCCRFGKHHFTAVDLLGYISSGHELFTPSFDNPVCPYHGGFGCLMEPSMRPFNCIIFICEELENRLDGQVREELVAIEVRLREIYGTIEQALGNRFANGLLITFQRTLDSERPLFNL